MGKNNNFNSPVTLRGANLEVTGISEALAGGRVVSRHIAFRQGDNIVAGPTTVDLAWKADPVLAAGGIVPGPALAIATETHLVDASFVTRTWAQIVAIDQPPAGA